jgi:hypothetical protein
MKLLIDVNVVIDICAQRKPHAEPSAIALEFAKHNHVRLWLYAGSTQTLEYNLYNQLRQENPLGCYGDGGAIFTSDDALAHACREIRVHGQSKRYVHTRIGVGGRMNKIAPASSPNTPCGSRTATPSRPACTPPVSPPPCTTRYPSLSNRPTATSAAPSKDCACLYRSYR